MAFFVICLRLLASSCALVIVLPRVVLPLKIPVIIVLNSDFSIEGKTRILVL